MEKHRKISSSILNSIDWYYQVECFTFLKSLCVTCAGSKDWNQVCVDVSPSKFPRTVPQDCSVAPWHSGFRRDGKTHDSGDWFRKLTASRDLMGFILPTLLTWEHVREQPSWAGRWSTSGPSQLGHTEVILGHWTEARVWSGSFRALWLLPDCEWRSKPETSYHQK